ncbi:hypothetical protein L6164_008461 [Bauhinia variegata]|uniref:Uncharacterized protein n=1 Tax=Bauhinia variegata TaxID=167791 RepID=A0ACB9PGJ4_BAUVA|nr:hypothetical protein L6164_008461 [Bauhinia variegata]
MASRSFTRYVEQELGKFPHFLLYALLEWVLIILLFIDGFLAFAANEFAKFFELKLPCWLCTRIDHVLVRRNVPDFYYNESICESHKKDVSSLAFCHNHKKLSDIRKMCEGCLLSFATEKESDIDTYKSLVGILHKDMECFVEEDQPIQLSLRDDDDDGVLIEKSNNQRCSCCGRPLKVKSSYHKGKNLGLVSQAPAPSPRAYVTSKNEDSRALELPHIRYSKLKFMSDKYSELPEEEGGSSVNNHEIKSREDVRAASVPLLAEAEDSNEELNKTPTFIKGNKFFGIPLTDSANNSPRWSYKINRRSTLEKTEFASPSLEGSTQNEAEEEIFNQLKSSQVRLDRKSLMALYMELDEERNASEVAASNAMAMITRLHAEKAAVQMEALQYQRMMEEQAEYDEEVLQATNDMLSKREEEIKVLETELDIYKEKYGCLTDDDLKDVRYDTNDKYGQTLKLQPYSFQGGVFSPRFSQGEDNGGGKIGELLKDFKGEKTFLLGRKKPEKNRTLLAENGVQSSESSSDSVNNVDNETGKEGEGSLREISSITDIVRALEADSGFLELVSKIDEDDSEGTKILTEISENLEKLRHLVIVPSESQPENA